MYKRQLYITSAAQRMVFGRTVCYSVSDFVSEIPKELKTSFNEEMASGFGRMATREMSNGHQSNANNPHSFRNNFFNSASRNPQEQFSKDSINSTASSNNEVTMGRKVRHSKFGVGTVVSTVKDGSETIVTIAFENMGIKKLILSKAGLELL